jgi:hypothetical protein
MSDAFRKDMPFAEIGFTQVFARCPANNKSNVACWALFGASRRVRRQKAKSAALADHETRGLFEC